MILKIRQQRDQVYRHFGDVNAQSDAVPFETGPLRAGDMAARDRIRRWQASLRIFYLLEAPLLQFRAFGDRSQKSQTFTALEDSFRAECAQAFLNMAETLESQLLRRQASGHAHRSLLSLLEFAESDAQASFSEREQALLRVTRTIAQLVDRLQTEIAAEPLYATP